MIGTLICGLGRTLLRLRYRVQVTGLEAVASKGTTGILFLPNHPALIDPVILVSRLYPAFRPRSLADQDQISTPGVGWIARKLGARPLMDAAKYGAASKDSIGRTLEACIQGLNAGENLLLYPAGRLMQSRLEDVGGNSAVESLLQACPGIRVVLVRDRGLWGSSFSRASGKAPNLVSALGKGLISLLANGIFFGPRRRVTLELVEPADLPREAGRHELNRYLEGFYNEGAPFNTYVPRTLWERGGVRELPEPVQASLQGDVGEVPESVRAAVIAQLRDMSGVDKVEDQAQLARDLGLDSLGRMELQAWLEQEFGCQGGDPESLRTVGDVLLTACGQAAGPGLAEVRPLPEAWTAPGLDPFIPEGATVPEVFLAQAARGPHRAILADQASGMRTYGDLLTAVLALRPQIRALEGDYLGLMLPASGGAAALYLAILFAGKIPVMVNWTAGAANMAYSLDLLGVKHVLTSAVLVAKLDAQGADLRGVRERLLAVEELGKRLTGFGKAWAWLQARLGAPSLRKATIPATAVVLFTSGSESRPKAVPLTHANVLTNIRDLMASYRFHAQDCLLGILPPFHSFGLTCTTVLPLCSGIRAAYHPNPTEGAALAKLVEHYGVTILPGTPTFLQGIVRAASDAQLASLRLVIAGAEKCPEALFQTLDQRWPGMRVLEGYGITECSPVVSANRVENPRRGSIGQALPSVHYALVDLDTGQRVEPGATGMLLVRGPSIFGGYLHHDGPSPFVEFEGKAWYRTGDLVREEPGGVLVFAGRLKRFVKLGGEMVSLPAVEEALIRRLVEDGAQEPVLAVEATPSETNPELVLFAIRSISREEANTAIREAGLSPIHNIRQVRLVEQIPLLGTGKTDYRALKALLEP